jgi:hypothetical protein
MTCQDLKIHRLMLTEQHEGWDPYTSTPTNLKYEGSQLWIDFTEEDKYSCDHPQGIAIEVYEGDLRVIVWADSESEDPTHTIVIKKAEVKESNND